MPTVADAYGSMTVLSVEPQMTKAEGDEFRRMYRMLRSRHGVVPTVPVDDD